MTIKRLLCANYKESVTISLEGCTKRSGRNPGHSPGFGMVAELSGRQYLAKEMSEASYMARYCLPGSLVSIFFTEDCVPGYDRFA